MILHKSVQELFFNLEKSFFGKCVYKRGRAFKLPKSFYKIWAWVQVTDSFQKLTGKETTMCMLRAGLVKNCRRCKSSIRLTCTARKKTTKKIFPTNSKKTSGAAKTA